MIAEIIKFYRPYLDRNKTFLEFADDVNTLGDTFGDHRWIETAKGKTIIKNRDFGIDLIVPLKEVWEAGKEKEQASLF